MSPKTAPPGPLEHQARELRDSSRRLVRVLGLMHYRLAGSDCSPAQCHALIEISARGQLTPGTVAELLEVDKSTASRTLRSLLQGGLIEAAADPGDQRTKPLRLSAEGRERVQQIHALADQQVCGALELLTEEERATVLLGVSLYERALHRAKARAQVDVRPIEARDDPAMASVIRSVMAEFGAVGGGYSSADQEVDQMHSAYAAARCAYFVAERDGVVIAGAGIAPLRGAERSDICELRKMHALPSARGLGVGRRLLESCLSAARSAGFGTCYLETLQHMHAARALYEKFEFRTLDGPLGSTGHFACNGWYALDL